jgi:hypothetical protein
LDLILAISFVLQREAWTSGHGKPFRCETTLFKLRFYLNLRHLQVYEDLAFLFWQDFPLFPKFVQVPLSAAEAVYQFTSAFTFPKRSSLKKTTCHQGQCYQLNINRFNSSLFGHHSISLASIISQQWSSMEVEINRTGEFSSWFADEADPNALVTIEGLGPCIHYEENELAWGLGRGLGIACTSLLGCYCSRI